MSGTITEALREGAKTEAQALVERAWTPVRHLCLRAYHGQPGRRGRGLLTGQVLAWAIEEALVEVGQGALALPPLDRPYRLSALGRDVLARMEAVAGWRAEADRVAVRGAKHRNAHTRAAA